MIASFKSMFFFFFWFLWIGGANILPQLYFIDADPINKEAWVALLLMLGSIVSVSGVWFAGRIPYSATAGSFKLLILFSLVVVTFGMLFVPISMPLYYLFYLSFRFVSCYTYQRLDYLFIHSGDTDKAALLHAKVSAVYMLLGVTLSPLFFAYFYKAETAIPSVIAIALLAYFTSSKAVKDSDSKIKSRIKAPFRREDKQFIIYSMAYLAVVFLASSLLVYFARDHYGMDEAAKKAGWVMVFTSSAAFLSSLSYGILRKDIGKDMASPLIQSVVLGLWIIAVILIYIKLFNTLVYLSFCGGLMGFSYGIYMVLGRQFASIRDRINNNGLITMFNMLPYYATILVFGIAGLLKLATKGTGWNYYTAILILLLSLLFIASSQAILIMIYSKKSR